MIRQIVLIVLALTPLMSVAQSIPLKSLDLIVGKEIIVKEKPEASQKFGFDGFYLDSSFVQIYACCENYSSRYNELVGKVFKVISYREYKFNYAKSKAKLVIENSDIGRLYFDYDPEGEDSFPFEVVGGLIFPEGFFCADFDIVTDKFTSEVTYRSPVKDQISFIKVINGDRENIYMRVKVYGRTLSIAKQGVVLLLKNGDKIVKSDEDIEVEVNGSGYTYSSFFGLTKQDLVILKNNSITDVRLYVYDSSVTNGDLLREYARCLDHFPN